MGVCIIFPKSICCLSWSFWQLTCQLWPAFPVSPSLFLYGFRCLEYKSQVFLLNTDIDPLPVNGWERWEWLISRCGLKRGWSNELESVGPILVVSIAKRSLFRPLWKWMGGLFLVRNRVSFSDKSSSHQSWARKAELKFKFILVVRRESMDYIYSGVNVREWCRAVLGRVRRAHSVCTLLTYIARGSDDPPAF